MYRIAFTYLTHIYIYAHVYIPNEYKSQFVVSLLKAESSLCKAQLPENRTCAFFPTCQVRVSSLLVHFSASCGSRLGPNSSGCSGSRLDPNTCQIERQIECQNSCQIECQSICQKECQNIYMYVCHILSDRMSETTSE
jgi:hypothetical protein